MQLGQLQMIITLSKKLISYPMTYQKLDNWIIFPYQLTLLKPDLHVRSYAHFSKGLSNRPNLRTETTDCRLNDGPLVQFIVWPTTINSGVFWSFPTFI